VPNSRKFSNWLAGYLELTSASESPWPVRMWCGIGTIAAALERRVWLDMRRFQLYPNHYIVLVAPPGVIQKTTCINEAMSLLWGLDKTGLKYPPQRASDMSTWQAIFEKLRSVGVIVEDKETGECRPMAAVTAQIGEMGNLLDTKDTGLTNLLITLWDCPNSLTKSTKMDGEKTLEGIYFNMLAGTTPSWVAGSFDQTTKEGGFASRCIFVYCDQKARLVAYPDDEEEGKDVGLLTAALRHDLYQMCEMQGQYKLTVEAKAWGKNWYDTVVWGPNRPAESIYMQIYKSRKQTHAHKVAMCLAAAKRNALVIEVEEMQEAVELLDALEPEMDKVFRRIGEHQHAHLQQELMELLVAKKEIAYAEAARLVQRHIPNARDIAAFLQVLRESGIADFIVNPADPNMVRIKLKEKK
jgi:hypothetical protein